VETESHRLLSPLKKDEAQKRSASEPSSDVMRPGVMAKILREVVAASPYAALRKPEPRSPQEYRGEVTVYLAELDRSLRDVAAARLAMSEHAAVDLVLENLGEENLQAVRLELRLEAAAIVFGDVWREAQVLPISPRRWGPHMPALEGIGDLGLSGISPHVFTGRRPPPRPSVARSGTDTHVTFPPVDLRPFRPARLEPVSIVGLGEQEALLVNWSATATNMPGQCSGEIEIRLGERATLEEALRPPQETTP